MHLKKCRLPPETFFCSVSFGSLANYGSGSLEEQVLIQVDGLSGGPLLAALAPREPDTPLIKGYTLNSRGLILMI